MQAMTAKQAAETLGESYFVFIRKLNRGEYPDLPHLRKGLGKRPHYLFYKEKLEDWIERRMKRRIV